MNTEESALPPEEFFQSFSWAVPTAFSASLNQCHFERGDLFYDTTKAYQRWDKALKHITFSIQVSYPPRSVGRTSKNQDVFGDNWKSEVTFTVRNHRNDESHERTSTQGRLYTLLWKGDWSVLDAAESPATPLTCLDRSLAKQLETAATEIKPHLKWRRDNASLFVMAYDPTHPIASVKYDSVGESLRKNFTVTEKVFDPAAVGLGKLLIVPTVTLVAFIIDATGEKALEALKDALYSPSPDRVTEVDRFNINMHGHFTPAEIHRKSSPAASSAVGI